MFDNLALAMGGLGGGSAAGGQSNPLGAFVPLILMFAIFYFLLIRPQQKKAKEHKAMIGNLKVGDAIVTHGGIYGSIVRFNDKRSTVVIEIADKVHVEMLRNTVADLQSSFEKVDKEKKAK